METIPYEVGSPALQMQIGAVPGKTGQAATQQHPITPTKRAVQLCGSKTKPEVQPCHLGESLNLLASVSSPVQWS